MGQPEPSALISAGPRNVVDGCGLWGRDLGWRGVVAPPSSNTSPPFPLSCSLATSLFCLPLRHPSIHRNVSRLLLLHAPWNLPQARLARLLDGYSLLFAPTGPSVGGGGLGRRRGQNSRLSRDASDKALPHAFGL